MERLLVAGIILIAFFLLIFVALDCSKKMEKPDENVIEHFSGPTTAADCNCLPGYVPSKMNGAYNCISLANGSSQRCY